MHDTPVQKTHIQLIFFRGETRAHMSISTCVFVSCLAAGANVVCLLLPPRQVIPARARKLQLLACLLPRPGAGRVFFKLGETLQRAILLVVGEGAAHLLGWSSHGSRAGQNQRRSWLVPLGLAVTCQVSTRLEDSVAGAARTPQHSPRYKPCFATSASSAFNISSH